MSDDVNPVKIFTSPFKAIGDILSPDFPDEPEPLPAPPSLESAAPQLESAAADVRKRFRRGRASTMITGGAGVTTPLGAVNRPEAFRAAQVLGQVG